MPEETKPIEISASPAKRFFVEMLTRDIALEDAILDLLDNCVDGATRSQKAKGLALQDFSGYQADIAFDRQSFTLIDNCGGIPLDVAERYAFRMGKPKPEGDEGNLPTVGVYGIGMKRALFRLGSHAEVLWRCKGAAADYQVEFDKRWLGDDEDWHLFIKPVERSARMSHPDGTLVSVRDLHPAIGAALANKESFAADMIDRISELYSVIIGRGFRVSCNRTEVKPKRLALLDASASVKDGRRVEPFIYKDEIDGVKVLLAIGLTQPLVRDSDAENAEIRKRKTEDAGITVICNDRVVLYNDRTEVTGWGELGVPSYHTQFISIGGYAQFSCDNPLKLPLTTTKRGVDESSDIYAAVKAKMREGLKIFTDYTNKWKPSPEGEHAYSKKAAPTDIPTLAGRRMPSGVKTIRPNLPAPPAKSTADRLTVVQYKRGRGRIAKVSKFFFGRPNESAVKVGERSFDHCLEQAMESEEG